MDYVKFFKDGDAMSIETTCTTLESFMSHCGEALAALIERRAFETDWAFQLGFWLPQIVEIASKLKGYKADVYVEQVIRCGDSSPNPGEMVLKHPSRPGDPEGTWRGYVFPENDPLGIRAEAPTLQSEN